MKINKLMRINKFNLFMLLHIYMFISKFDMYKLSTKGTMFNIIAWNEIYVQFYYGWKYI